MFEKFLKIIGAYKLYRKWLENSIKSKPVPQHIGVILDGNRRWARNKGITLEESYRIGARKVEELLEILAGKFKEKFEGIF